MKEVNKTIKDYKAYLDEIAILAKPLDSAQKERLNTILSSQLTLLVYLKQASKMGKVTLNWK